MDEPHYVIVDFPEESSTGEIAMGLISSTWISQENAGQICYWPAYLKSTVSREKAVRNHSALDHNKTWRCPILILHRLRDYDKAKAKLQRLEDCGTSSPSDSSFSEPSGELAPLTNTRKSKAKIDDNYNYDFDDDDDLDHTLIDSPPPLKKTIKPKIKSKNNESSSQQVYEVPDVCFTNQENYSIFGDKDKTFSNLKNVSQPGEVFLNQEPQSNIKRTDLNCNLPLKKTITPKINCKNNESSSQQVFEVPDVFFANQENYSIFGDKDKTFRNLKNVSQPGEVLPSYKPQSNIKQTDSNCNCDSAKIFKLMSRLLRDVQEIKNELKKINATVQVQKSTEFQNLELELNFLTYDALCDFNEKLGEVEYFEMVQTTLALLGGRDVGECIRKILNAIMGPDLSLKVNWIGANSKGSFQKLNNLRRLIYGTVRRNTASSSATNTEIDSVIKTWLKNAADREGGRNHRRKCKSQVGNNNSELETPHETN